MNAHALTVIDNETNVESYRASTNAASLCKEIVLETAKSIQGRKYVCVEGWQAIAIAHGCAASARDVERVDGGVRAVGEVRRMSDGALIAQGEGFVGEDEPTWFGGETVAYGKTKILPKRADYAIRAMAQTRAISRACRSAFAHVVVMMNAGLATTPAEEVPHEGFDRDMGEVQARTEPGPMMISDEQRDLVQTLAQAAGKPPRDICEAYKIESLKGLTAAQAVKLIDHLKGLAPTQREAAMATVIDDEIPY